MLLGLGIRLMPGLVLPGMVLLQMLPGIQLVQLVFGITLELVLLGIMLEREIPVQL